MILAPGKCCQIQLSSGCISELPKFRVAPARADGQSLVFTRASHMGPLACISRVDQPAIGEQRQTSGELVAWQDNSQGPSLLRTQLGQIARASSSEKLASGKVSCHGLSAPGHPCVSPCSLSSGARGGQEALPRPCKHAGGSSPSVCNPNACPCCELRPACSNRLRAGLAH